MIYWVHQVPDATKRRLSINWAESNSGNNKLEKKGDASLGLCATKVRLGNHAER